MPKSDQGRAAFPYNPLIFSTSLTPAGADLPGAAILSELPAEHALLLWDVLRAVLLFAGGAEERAWWSAEQMRSWEEAVLTDTALPEPARAPLSAVVRELANPRECDVARLSWACLCLCDWAVESGATETALAWAEAAALAWPANARLAWIAGKMFRKHGRFTEAKQWLRRAARLAVWSRDFEVQARALIALGNLHLHAGAYPRARKLHQRALRLARRNRMREVEAMALHDLFLGAYGTKRFADAEILCREALDAYGTAHPRLPQFAHDVAYFWITRGYFARALEVLVALLPIFHSPEERLRILASLVRSAGGAGNHSVFDKCWDEAWELAGIHRSDADAGRIFLDLGYGASSLAEWRRSQEAFHRASESAQKHGESDVLIAVEESIIRVSEKRTAEPAIQHPLENSRGDGGKAIRDQLIRCLSGVGAQNSG